MAGHDETLLADRVKLNLGFVHPDNVDSKVGFAFHDGVQHFVRAVVNHPEADFRIQLAIAANDTRHEVVHGRWYATDRNDSTARRRDFLNGEEALFKIVEDLPRLA